MRSIHDAGHEISRGRSSPTVDRVDDVAASVVGIWQALDHDVPVTTETNVFTDLGATEFAAASVTDRVCEALGRSISVQTIYDCPTLGSYLDALRNDARPAVNRVEATAQAVHDRPALRPGAYNDARGMVWPGDRSAINVPFVLEVEGSLDVTALRRAMTRLVQRHETLRSGFDRTGAQIVLSSCPVEIEEVSCAHDEFDRLCVRRATEPFIVTTAPLWRTTLVRAGDRCYLVTVFSHLITDAASLGVFHHELAVLYSDELGQAREELPAAPQYATLTAQDHEPTDEALAWWCGALDVEPPTWRARPTDATVWSRAEGLTFDDRGPTLLGAFPGVTPPTIVRAAVLAALSPDLPTGEVVLAVLQSRRDARTRRIIGWLQDYLPVPVQVRSGDTATVMVARVAEATAQALRCWRGSATPILEHVGAELGRAPESLMHVHVNYLPVGSQAGWEKGGQSTRFVPYALPASWDERMPGPTTGAALQFHLNVDRTEARLVHLAAEGPSDVFTRAELREKAQRVAETLDQMLSNPHWRI